MTDQATRTAVLTAASDIRSERSRFLWDPYVPLGTVTIFAGRGGEGKSSLALYLAAQTQTGALVGDLHGQQRAVLVIGHEDDWGRVVKPRLIGAGADLTRVFRLHIETVVDKETHETVPTFPLDVNLIRAKIIEQNAGLVIIDPITSTIDGDLHKVADVRRSLDPLIRVAQETNTAIVALMHFNKGSGHLGDKLSGSHAFRDATRSLLLFATDEDSGQRIVTLEKSSYSAATGTSFAFELRPTLVDTDDGDATEVPQVHYIGETEMNVGDLVNYDSEAGEERSEAARWLRHKLEDAGGSEAARELRKCAAQDGLSWDSVKRASRTMTTKQKAGFGKDSQWRWTLDDSKGAKSAKGAKEAKGEQAAAAVPPSQSEQTVSGAAPNAPFAPFGAAVLPLVAPDPAEDGFDPFVDPFPSPDGRRRRGVRS